LVIDRARGGFDDHGVADLPVLLRPGDCLIVNNSRVIPARVLARDAGGDPVELPVFEATDAHHTPAPTRPGPPGPTAARPPAGGAVRSRAVGPGAAGPRVVERLDGAIEALLHEHGMTPLPPYIDRFAAPTAEDLERYQTVYARPPGSIAAPTAGLHFTPVLLDAIRRRGVEVHELTLHVGPGTFRPIKAARVEDHALAPERAAIAQDVADAVNRARDERRRVIAVGTTTTRALESAVGVDGRVRPLEGEARLYITPGYAFRAVDALLTNFHLPRSSLLA